MHQPVPWACRLVLSTSRQLEADLRQLAINRRRLPADHHRKAGPGTHKRKGSSGRGKRDGLASFEGRIGVRGREAWHLQLEVLAARGALHGVVGHHVEGDARAAQGPAIHEGLGHARRQRVKSPTVAGRPIIDEAFDDARPVKRCQREILHICVQTDGGRSPWGGARACTPAPLVATPLMSGSPPPQPQFQCNPKKYRLRRLMFPMLAQGLGI